MRTRKILKIGSKRKLLTIIEFLPNNMLKLQCDCGNFKIIKDKHFGTLTSCGHLIKRKGNQSPYYKGYKNVSGTYFNNIKRHAKTRKILFSINIEYINNLLEKQNFRCALSGLPIKIGSYIDKDITASLDRIDSNKGYVENNVQWVHKDINRIKWNLPENKFFELCKLVTEKQNSDKIKVEIINEQHH